MEETKMCDNYCLKQQRDELVDQLRKKGINDDAILSAIGRIPRHHFVDPRLVKYAYRDQPCRIAEGQTISQPYTVAFQTALLKISPSDKVLEVGTGSGYQTALLMELGAEVFTIERHRLLSDTARELLHQLGYAPHFFCGDGSEGLLQHAPFTKILVTAGAKQIPKRLLDQLAGGGRMVIPVGGSQGQDMQLIERIADKQYHITHHGRFLFVPLISGSQEG